MDIVKATIGGVCYHIGQAPALQQKTLLTLVGARAAVAAQGAVGKGMTEIDDKILSGMLLSLDEGTLDRVSDIVLGKVFVAGSTVPVDIGCFQGKMSEYLLLVAAAIKANLDDFFTFLVADLTQNQPE